MVEKKDVKPPMTRYEMVTELLEHGLEVYQDDAGRYIVIDFVEIPAKEIQAVGTLDELYNFVLKMRNQ